MRILKKYRIGNFLIPNQSQISINPSSDYKQIKLRLYQKGVELRGIKKGNELGSKQYSVCKDQFIISKIDARNGAMGIVPEDLHGAVVTGDFLLYDFDENIINAKYFDYYTRLDSFDRACKICSEGSTNRVRLKGERFLNYSIYLPSLFEQQRIVSKIGNIEVKLEQINHLKANQTKDINNLLFSKYSEHIKEAKWLPMSEVAPIIRREVRIIEGELYPELGIRCFGKGTFYKPSLTAVEVGTKRIFQIKEGDLIFSNVFAWEGGIAVAKEEDNNRYGSHRFISCIPDGEKAIAEFLCYHFLSPKGLEDINACSPGGAGRNKTLGLDKLMRIKVPVPEITLQQEFLKLLKKVEAIKNQYNNIEKELNDLVPSLLDKAFERE